MRRDGKRWSKLDKKNAQWQERRPTKKKGPIRSPGWLMRVLRCKRSDCDENEQESDDSTVHHLLRHHVYVANRQWKQCPSMSRHCSSAIVICCSVWHWPVILHSLVYSLEHEILARLCHVPPPQIMIDKWTWRHQDSSCLVFDWHPCLQPTVFSYLAAFS